MMKIIQLILNDQEAMNEVLFSESYNKIFTVEHLTELASSGGQYPKPHFLMSGHQTLAEDINQNGLGKIVEPPKKCEGFMEVFYETHLHERESFGVSVIPTSKYQAKGDKKLKLTLEEKQQGILAVFNKFYQQYAEADGKGASFEMTLFIPYHKDKKGNLTLAFGNHRSTPFEDGDRAFLQEQIENLQKWEQLYQELSEEGLPMQTIARNAKNRFIITEAQHELLIVPLNLPSAPNDFDGGDTADTLYPAVTYEGHFDESPIQIDPKTPQQRFNELVFYVSTIEKNQIVDAKYITSVLEALYDEGFNHDALEGFVLDVLSACETLDELEQYRELIDFCVYQKYSDDVIIKIRQAIPYELALIQGKIIQYIRNEIPEKERPDEKFITAIQDAKTAEALLKALNDLIFEDARVVQTYSAEDRSQGAPLVKLRLSNIGVNRGSWKMKRNILKNWLSSTSSFESKSRNKFLQFQKIAKPKAQTTTHLVTRIQGPAILNIPPYNPESEDTKTVDSQTKAPGQDTSRSQIAEVVTKPLNFYPDELGVVYENVGLFGRGERDAKAAALSSAPEVPTDSIESELQENVAQQPLLA